MGTFGSHFVEVMCHGPDNDRKWELLVRSSCCGSPFPWKSVLLRPAIIIAQQKLQNKMVRSSWGVKHHMVQEVNRQDGAVRWIQYQSKTMNELRSDVCDISPMQWLTTLFSATYASRHKVSWNPTGIRAMGGRSCSGWITWRINGKLHLFLNNSGSLSKPHVDSQQMTVWETAFISSHQSSITWVARAIRNIPSQMGWLQDGTTHSADDKRRSSRSWMLSWAKRNQTPA